MHRIILSFLLLLFACQPIVPERQKHLLHSLGSVTVTFVIDGDTLITNVGKVRLVGIDAPEKGDCGYEEAGKRLRELSIGKTVTLVDDVRQPDRDTYGRLLRYVEIDGEDVATVLLRDGFVRAFPWIPSGRLSVYRELELKAKEKGIGVLWAECNEK